ncbi:hypothetical protein [Paraburkholderia sp. SOS3]|jgi:signal transduction histidine kinase|nr:hypothetical protein [Paraburkholderia sp. SOS3]
MTRAAYRSNCSLMLTALADETEPHPRDLLDNAVKFSGAGELRTDVANDR